MECRLIAEGVVVTASTDQSTPRFDKSQKLELERVCVCVSVLHTHTHTHTHTQQQQQQDCIVVALRGRLAR